jgi:hypothetical protein
MKPIDDLFGTAFGMKGLLLGTGKSLDKFNEQAYKDKHGEVVTIGINYAAMAAECDYSISIDPEAWAIVDKNHQTGKRIKPILAKDIYQYDIPYGYYYEWGDNGLLEYYRACTGSLAIFLMVQMGINDIFMVGFDAIINQHDASTAQRVRKFANINRPKGRYKNISHHIRQTIAKHRVKAKIYK